VLTATFTTRRNTDLAEDRAAIDDEALSSAEEGEKNNSVGIEVLQIALITFSILGL